MEEATVLCDRLGIFVDGTLVCIGNPKELTSRYGGYLVFTITTPLEQEAAAHALVTRMSPGARLTYALAGTRKYELPVQEVTLPGAVACCSWGTSAVQGVKNGCCCRFCSICGTAPHLWAPHPLLAHPHPRPASPSAGVFETMEAAKAELRVLDWGVANATLEEVSAAVAIDMQLCPCLLCCQEDDLVTQLRACRCSSSLPSRWEWPADDRLTRRHASLSVWRAHNVTHFVLPSDKALFCRERMVPPLLYLPSSV
jgi:hypothetical protein